MQATRSPFPSLSGAMSSAELAQRAAADAVRASIPHLFQRASSLPCTAAAQAFLQLVQPISRFQIALDALLPILHDKSYELSHRILVCYILYSLYAPHPMEINPFHSTLKEIYNVEREAAVASSTGKDEQLVWVLWTILKGDGAEIGSYSPWAIARSPLPEELKPAKLSLDKPTQAKRGTSPLPDASKVIERPKPKDLVTENSENRQMEAKSIGMSLLLAARSRVLNLTEQRTLLPLLPSLIPLSVITPDDLPSLAANNAAVAHPLIVLLLTTASDKNNPDSKHHFSSYLEPLTALPPVLASFDLFGRLLLDKTGLITNGTPYAEGQPTTISELVRTEALSGFVSSCVRWIDRAEREMQEGLIADDRCPKAVVNLCRFFTSLTKRGLIDPRSELECAEMMHFALRFARFEEANTLYRVLALARN